MAITFQKQPLTFFNVNEPAIFEFTTDADLGVNPNDLVADLKISSEWTVREYTIKNILPKYGTGVFRVDVSGYLKSLMLDNFEYDFNSSNRQFTIEKFTIGVAIHAENGADIFADEYVFDSGYIFDTTFVFAEQTPSDTREEFFYPIVGITQLNEKPLDQKSDLAITILSPQYVEFAQGFGETISIYVDEQLTGGELVFVGGQTSPIPNVIGVSTADISDEQIDQMYLPKRITTDLNNGDLHFYGISYKESDCEDTLVFRYFTSYGGYAYFHTAKEGLTANRGKSDFVNNNFYNQQEFKSTQKQRSAPYTESLALSGTKRIELSETFKELLRSIKVEVLLPRGYTECEVTGSHNLRTNDFEYTLNVVVSNEKQMEL